MKEETKADILNNRINAVQFPVDNLQINDVVKMLLENFNKVLYVSLNRLYNPLKRKMADDGIDTSKVLFVDCVTKTAVAKPDDADDCIFVTSPSALTEMSIAITKTIQRSYPDVVVFDNLSTLMIYEDENTISQFMHSLVNKMHAFGINLVFVILEGEKEKAIVNHLNMMTDKVIKYE